MVLLSLWMALVAKAVLIADVAKSEPILTAIFGLFLISAASVIRRLSTIADLKRSTHPAPPANKVPVRHTPDFRITDVPPSRMEVSEQAVELS